MLLFDLLPRKGGESASTLRLTGAAARALLAWEWPGNTRELEQTMGRAAALARDGVIDVAELGLATGKPGADSSADQPTTARDEMVTALTRHGGNVAEMARAMGKSRMTVHRWLRRYGLDPESYRRAK